jgi:cell division protein FtsZ
MMGTATVSGVDRARLAAEQAVASPLLEGIDLSGARGVLVNITAHEDTLKGSEVSEILNTVRNFCAPDALVIHGVAYSDEMGEDLRVTVVVTGLGRTKKMTLVTPQPMMQSGLRSGTYDAPVAQAVPQTSVAQALGSPSFESYDTPAVWRSGRGEAAARVAAMEDSGMDRFDIPAFLRKQAD